MDSFYEEDDGEEDVAPDYFHSCELLVTSYPIDKVMSADVPIRPLFQGSQYMAKDLARFILSFKARHLKVGDGILANVVAMMATFLPEDNAFKQLLPSKTTIYLLLKTLDNIAQFKTSLRTLKIDYCSNKCMGFYDINSTLNFCRVCGESRWKLCSNNCFEINGEQRCHHSLTPRKLLYYNVVQDRLVKLLKSDLKNLFEYDVLRAGKFL
jgi:hypothetical protein